MLAGSGKQGERFIVRNAETGTVEEAGLIWITCEGPRLDDYSTGGSWWLTFAFTSRIFPM